VAELADALALGCSKGLFDDRRQWVFIVGKAMSGIVTDYQRFSVIRHKTVTTIKRNGEHIKRRKSVRAVCSKSTDGY